MGPSETAEVRQPFETIAGRQHDYNPWDWSSESSSKSESTEQVASTPQVNWEQ
jgi:hypothetical protein